MRPVFFRDDATRIGFVDPQTGIVVGDDGRAFVARPGAGRRRPNVADIADALAAAGIGRAYVTGGPWPAAWLTFTDPDRSGWIPGKRGHYDDKDDPRLSLERVTVAGPQRVDLRRAGSWGLPDVASPRDVREAWCALESALAARFGRGRQMLRATATATGQQLAALAAPRDWDGEQLEDDLAQLIRRTSPQHRMETPGSCYTGCDMHRPRPDVGEQLVTVVDARFAFASLCKGLGVAPAARLTAAESTALLSANRYARARFRARVTVPDGWDFPGLLMAQHPDGRHWHSPDRPGATFETWADAVELSPALTLGWRIELLEGLAFRPACKPLDVWADRLIDVWAAASTTTRLEAPLGDYAARMVRTILLSTIGGFHSTGRDVAHIADEPLDVPSSGVVKRRELPDGRILYHTRQAPTGASASHARPELSSQIWSRAHARLHTAPNGAGFMALGPDAVWGMWGDALYLTGGDPGWADDGAPGRYRVKGTSTRTLTRPRGVGDLLRLRAETERQTA